eukprot:6130732-Prymnesium_polylepis.1
MARWIAGTAALVRKSTTSPLSPTVCSMLAWSGGGRLLSGGCEPRPMKVSISGEKTTASPPSSSTTRSHSSSFAARSRTATSDLAWR